MSELKNYYPRPAWLELPGLIERIRMINFTNQSKKQTMQTDTITAKQIHDDFFGAEERLYVDAIGLTTRSSLKSSKADRLKKIGFGQAKPIKDVEDLIKRKSQSGDLIEAIEHYRTYYPHNKFITEEEVEKLCKKYGLLLGNASNYIGDMPEKNLREIENFRLRKADWIEKEEGFYPSLRSGGMLGGRGHSMSHFSDIMNGYLDYERMIRAVAWPDASRPVEREIVKVQAPFKICAPEQDFNTFGFEIREGYKLVWDPIVLQPVKFKKIEGHLIVTAWGDEASDELLVNSIKN